jgi:stringent starvation protein B
MGKGRKVDPLKLECGDVCDVEVILTMRDGSTKAGLAIGGGGDKISLVTRDGGVRSEVQIPVADVVTAHRARRS